MYVLLVQALETLGFIAKVGCRYGYKSYALKALRYANVIIDQAECAPMCAVPRHLHVTVEHIPRIMVQ